MGADTGTESQQPSTGELLAQLTDQSARLVREEVEHAKAELRDDVRHVGLGVGLAGTAGLLALYGLAALLVAAGAALALAMDVWLAALVVAIGLFVIAGAAALVAKAQAAQAGPPIRTVESLKQDVATVKGDRR